MWRSTRKKEIIVNNRVVDLNYFVYENFNIEWTILSFRTHVSDTIEEMTTEGIEENSRYGRGTGGECFRQRNGR